MKASLARAPRVVSWGTGLSVREKFSALRRMTSRRPLGARRRHRPLQQVVLLQLAVERRPVQAEDVGRRALVPPRLLERAQDRQPLDLLERAVLRDRLEGGLV